MAKEESNSIASNLVSFLNASPTAFHAVGIILFSLASFIAFPFVFRYIRIGAAQESLTFSFTSHGVCFVSFILIFQNLIYWNAFMFQTRQRNGCEARAISSYQREMSGNWKQAKDISSPGTTQLLSLLPLVKGMIRAASF